MDPNNTVTCIARQRTVKHLATEYTHATTELRMLFLVARQQLVSSQFSDSSWSEFTEEYPAVYLRLLSGNKQQCYKWL
jgi:hypothetical protein